MVQDSNEEESGGDLAESNQFRMPTETTGPQSGGPQDGVAEEHRCGECNRSFETSIGLGVHRTSAHPEQANEAIDIDRVNRRWSDEEVRMMASIEAVATLSGQRFMNQHILGSLPNRTLEGIKGKRRGREYKQMVQQEITRLNTEAAIETTNEQQADAIGQETAMEEEVMSEEPVGDGSTGEMQQRERMRKVMEEAIKEVEKMEQEYAAELVEIGRNALRDGARDDDKLADLMNKIITNTQEPKGPVLSKITEYHGTREQRRKQRYGAVQKMFRKDIGAAARMVLNENDLIATVVPNTTEMFNFWKEIFENGEEGEVRMQEGGEGREHMQPLWEPVSKEEIKQAKTSTEKAAGPDGITPKAWNKVNINVKWLLYNILMFYEGVPKRIKLSRTVFLPKVDGGSTDPGDFRPLTICSVILREFNKVLAKRLTTCHIYDERQTAYLPMDGVGINVSVLTAVISEARKGKKELHLAILDLIKAFNSVYHKALLETIKEVGCPKGFVNYVKDMYTDVVTRLQFENNSMNVFIRIGVYQGDPLSGPLFTLAYERALKALDANVGFDMAGTRINANAYSDDGTLMAMTVFGLQQNINRFSDALAKIGLKINPRKSSTLSLVPSGRDKKMKVVNDRPFTVDGEPMKTLSITDFWRYLGVTYDVKGPTKATTTLTAELDKITRGPLKPQQRMRLLKSFVIPKFQDRLVLSRTTATGLKKMDAQIRSCIRKWLHLPHDCTKAYMYAPVKQGGLGVPCLQLWIPMMRLNRLNKVISDGGDRVKAVLGCELFKSIIHGSKQALAVLEKEEPNLNDYHAYWKNQLNGMVDGKDLQNASNNNSTNAINSTRMEELRSEDYVHFNQIRSNSIPTRKRLSRGRDKTTVCRAGCRQVETLQHVIQMCQRTHGGRILRHNRAVDILETEFKKDGRRVDREKVFRTSKEIYKPDLVVVTGSIAYVVDMQVVKCTDLENDHNVKVRKYDDVELKGLIRAKYGVEEVKFEACTISYKGIWSKKSATGLKRLGIGNYCMFQIVTTVLRGTWLNWKTFNRVTTVFR